MVEKDCPTMNCPKCGAEQVDMDGFGFIACIPGCGFCKHPSAMLVGSEWICGICNRPAVNGTGQRK